MRFLLILIPMLVVLSACDPDRQHSEDQIKSTLTINWHAEIPVDGLAEAHSNCLKYPDIDECQQIDQQIQDIAATLATCRADVRSVLCQKILSKIGNHPIAAILPNMEALQLPETPFYLSLPTDLLNAQSGIYGYRLEVTIRYWRKWRVLICSLLATISIGICLWKFWTEWIKVKNYRLEIEEQQQEALIKEENLKRILEEQELAAERNRIRIEREAFLAEQKRIAEKNLLIKQEAEAATKLEAEQAKVSEFLKLAFKSSKKNNGESL